MGGIAFLLAGIDAMGWGVVSKETVKKHKRGGVKFWVWVKNLTLKKRVSFVGENIFLNS